MKSPQQPRAAGDANITALLTRFSQGHKDASGQLIGAVQPDLRRIAVSWLRREKPHFPVEPTELVNQTYLKLADRRATGWADRKHFFSYSSRVMSHWLVDKARRERVPKGTSSRIQIPISDNVACEEHDADLSLDISMAFERLDKLDSRAAAVLKYDVAGWCSTKVAAELGVSTKTVSRDLDFARAWMRRELHGGLK